MATYTLKTFCGTHDIERFDHRRSYKLRSVLENPRYHHAGETGPFGEIENHPDRFEIFDSQMEKIFNGNVNDALNFIRTLR